MFGMTPRLPALTEKMPDKKGLMRDAIMAKLKARTTPALPTARAALPKAGC
jgi:hypothetical protein